VRTVLSSISNQTNENQSISFEFQNFIQGECRYVSLFSERKDADVLFSCCFFFLLLHMLVQVIIIMLCSNRSQFCRSCNTLQKKKKEKRLTMRTSFSYFAIDSAGLVPLVGLIHKRNLCPMFDV
jgi:hypothetical protein